MNPEDVQDAIKSLQRFLLDEYGWDTKGTENMSKQFVSPPVQTGNLSTEYLTAQAIYAGKSTLSP